MVGIESSQMKQESIMCPLIILTLDYNLHLQNSLIMTHSRIHFLCDSLLAPVHGITWGGLGAEGQKKGHALGECIITKQYAQPTKSMLVKGIQNFASLKNQRGGGRGEGGRKERGRRKREIRKQEGKKERQSMQVP